MTLRGVFFVTMKAMIQENKKDVRMETIQNWVAFGLMAIGVALSVTGNIWASYGIGAGIIMGLFFIVKRTLPKRLSIVTVVSMLCSVYLPLSYWLLMTFPDIYGQELGALFNWVISLMVAGLAAVVLTSIELFRTSKG
jgi:hypothetical protein